MATPQERLRNIGIGVVSLALAAAGIICAWQRFGSQETPNRTPQATSNPNNLLVEQPFTPIPAVRPDVAIATQVPVLIDESPNELSCFDIFGNEYADGETTPHSNQPARGNIVYCDDGKFDVTTTNPDGSKYHTLFVSARQPR